MTVRRTGWLLSSGQILDFMEIANGQIVKRVGNEIVGITAGTGGGLDADTVDGEHASAFEDAGTAAAAITTHLSASDPHTQYQKESEKDSANGFAGLNADANVTRPAIKLFDGTTTYTLPGFTDGMVLKRSGTTLVSVAQGAAIADPAGGAVIDTECRTAVEQLLAFHRARGDITS